MATDTENPRQDIALESEKSAPEHHPESKPSEIMDLDSNEVLHNYPSLLPNLPQNNHTHQAVVTNDLTKNNGVVDICEPMKESTATKDNISKAVSKYNTAPVEAPEEGEDLEDGEIDEDEEEGCTVAVVKEVIDVEKLRKHRKSDSKDEELGSDGDERRSSKHKKHKSSRKDRSKRSLEKELKSDEEKKRLLKEKLRALELQMGNPFSEDSNHSPNVLEMT